MAASANPAGILACILGLCASVLTGQTPPPIAPVSISLEQAVQLALDKNPSLGAQRLNIDQARAGEITAALKPNPLISIDSEDFPIFSPKYLNFQNLSENQEFTHALSYTIERGGKRRKRMAVARDNTEVAARNTDDAARQLRFQVSQTFIAVLLAKANLEFARQDLRDYTQVVDLNRRRMEAGDISEGDFLKIVLQKLQFEQDVAAADLALAQGKVGLRQLLGYETVPPDFDVTGALEHKRRIVVLPEIQQQALLHRPDLGASRSGVKLATDTVALAYANRARDLGTGTEFKRNGTINGVGFSFNIEIPIHDRNQGEIARSRYALRQSLQQDNAARIAVLTDVDNAYQAFHNADAVATLYETGYLEQARSSRDISRYGFRSGAASLLDLLDAERSYRAIQLAYRQALAAYMTSVEQINMAVGAQVMP
jgi:cobalt-zinc-cadmium efflux system outer membrane protein